MNANWRRMGVLLVLPPLLAGLPCVASASEARWPLEGVLTSDFGPRRGKAHRGIDVAAPTGTVVVAVLQGRVAFAGQRGAYGLLVELEHEDGWVSRYAHLDAVEVREGDQVEAGVTLGTVGATGNATG